MITNNGQGKQTEGYLEKLLELVSAYYAFGDIESEARPKAKHHLNGYLQAGTHCNLAPIAAIQELLESAHREAFGMSIEERKIQKKLGLSVEIDWSLYEEPAIFR